MKAENVSDLLAVKVQHGVPAELQFCHTAMVDGYIIEGHVSADDIERLLEERPDVAGLAMPRMPMGSPVMEVEGAPEQPFDVLAFDRSGNIVDVFASYP